MWNAYITKIQADWQGDWHTKKLVKQPQIIYSNLTKIVIIPNLKKLKAYLVAIRFLREGESSN